MRGRSPAARAACCCCARYCCSSIVGIVERSYRSLLVLSTCFLFLCLLTCFLCCCLLFASLISILHTHDQQRVPTRSHAHFDSVCPDRKRQKVLSVLFTMVLCDGCGGKSARSLCRHCSSNLLYQMDRFPFFLHEPFHDE